MIFGQKFWEFSTQGETYYLIQGRIEPNIRKLRKHGRTQNFSLDRVHLWWPSLISCHIVSHFGRQPLPEITKMAVMAVLLDVETCTEKQTPLSFGQSSK